MILFSVMNDTYFNRKEEGVLNIQEKIIGQLNPIAAEIVLLETPLTCTFGNSVDPDEMPCKAAFHKGLHCLLRQMKERNPTIFGKL